MDSKLNKVLLLDQEIGDFLENNDDLNDLEISNKFEEKKYLDRAIKLIKRMSNYNRLELLKRARYLTSFVDLKKFIKKYPINKAKLKKNSELYLEEYRRLQNTCLCISSIAVDREDFYEYMDIIDVDNVERYLLKHMPNEHIYYLACNTNMWDEKLYFYSFLKRK